jgi:hydroxymethylbilane synthase
VTESQSNATRGVSNGSSLRTHHQVATRSSPLAVWQARHILALLTAAVDAKCTFETLFVDTVGDRTQSLGTPLHEIGGQGVFVKEVQTAVLDGRASFAVHSAKDMSSTQTPGLTIAAIPARGDVRDVLIGSTLNELEEGAIVGTGSVRRRAQLAALRPDLRFGEIRGNIGTRIAKLSQFDAIVLAVVPLVRLGLLDDLVEQHHVEVLSTDVMLPMVSQGALVVECRTDDLEMREMLARLNDPSGVTTVTTERAYLEYFGAGCDFPLACLATVKASGDIVADGLVAAKDGTTIVRAQLTGTDPLQLGRALAQSIMEQGGAAVLEQNAGVGERLLDAAQITSQRNS